MAAIATLRLWIALPAMGAGVLGLSYFGSQAPAARLLAAPLIAVIVRKTAESVPPSAAGLAIAGICAIIGAAAAPVEAYWFIAAALTGLFLPVLYSRRLAEDDVFFLLPLIFWAMLLLLGAADRATRDGAGWAEWRTERERSVGQIREIERVAILGRRLPPGDAARWARSAEWAPFRLTGLWIAFVSIAFYGAAALGRTWVYPLRMARNRFALFRLKPIYTLALAAALALEAAWIWRGTVWIGHASHGLYYWSAAAFALQTAAMLAYAMGGAGEAGAAGLAAGIVAALFLAPAVLGAPELASAAAVVCIGIGLADVWLDFRGIDRIRGGIQP